MKEKNIKKLEDLDKEDINKIKEKDLIIFDMDGTLTKSKQKIEKDMAELLCNLLKEKSVAVISGGKYDQFKKQLLSGLNCKNLFKNLYLFPTNSTAFYQYKDGWQEIYKEELSPLEKNQIMSAIKKAFYELSYTPSKKIYGKQIEDRGSQITFSALGQDAPLEEKREWNNRSDNRKEIINEIKKHLHGFEVESGGLTSIDITKEGINKSYGIRKIKKQLNKTLDEMVFVGDALSPEGNDYAAAETGIESINVSSAEETKKLLEQIT